jgi:hypothetical protein
MTYGINGAGPGRGDALACYRSDRSFYLRMARDARLAGDERTLARARRDLADVRAEYREAAPAKPTFVFIHWTPFTEGARSIMAVYEVPADRPSYVWWRRYIRQILGEGETLESCRRVDSRRPS